MAPRLDRSKWVAKTQAKTLFCLKDSEVKIYVMPALLEGPQFPSLSPSAGTLWWHHPRPHSHADPLPCPLSWRGWNARKGPTHGRGEAHL